GQRRQQQRRARSAAVQQRRGQAGRGGSGRAHGADSRGIARDIASTCRRARPCTRNAALRGFPGVRGGRAGEGTMLRTLIVLLLGLLGAATVATAAVPETPRLRIIGAAQGLPSTDFFGIARDRDGYIWVATGDGLA